jgi:hypothetical protein
MRPINSGEIFPPPGLPPFLGFPYVAICLLRGYCHVNLLPADLTVPEIVKIAGLQHYANRLPVLLVTGEDLSACFLPDGRREIYSEVPHRYIVDYGKLRLVEEFAETGELLERQAWLESHAALTRPPGRLTLFADPGAASWDATPEERAKLAGWQEGGVPAGLARCPRCREWKGVCLDPSPQLRHRITEVFCRCDNDNWCARCSHPLAERRLNKNWYEESDGSIRHYPGYHALEHRCPAKAVWIN